MTEAKIGDILKKEKPVFNSVHDALAALVHATFLGFGFHATEAGGAYAGERPFPADWNSNQSVYSFSYRNGRERIVVKCVVVDEKLLVNAVAKETNMVAGVDLEYVFIFSRI